MSDEPTRRTCSLVDERDGESCVVCGYSLHVVIGARHHRKPRSHASKAEKHQTYNLIDVCEKCHRYIHAHPTWAYDMGYLVHTWDDPSKKPLMHGSRGWVYLDDSGHCLKEIEVAA